VARWAARLLARWHAWLPTTTPGRVSTLLSDRRGERGLVCMPVEEVKPDRAEGPKDSGPASEA
jgi:hypothetical protein